VLNLGARLLDLWTTVRGGRLATSLTGAGPRTVVLVNGFGSTRKFWEPQVALLRGFGRVVTYDRRGYGDSDAAEAGHSLKDEVADLDAVIAQFVGAAVHLVAHSIGSLIALAYAAAHRDRVRRLVLIAGTPRLLRDADFPIGALAGEQLAAILARPDVAGSPGRWREDLRASLGADVRPLLRDLQVPTLLIHGTADRVIPFTHGVYLHGSLPDARLFPVEGRGHLPNYTAAAEVNGALATFLA
jgi:3-oxoadipate enol-lactonase